jgi:enediyne biosynthesis protein E4
MVAGVAIAGCHRGELDEPAEALRPAVVVAESGQAVSISPSASDASLAGTLLFTDVTSASGIDFQYYGVPSSEMYMTEQNGGGIALADFNNDDQLDVFLSNGSHFKKPASGLNQSSRLFASLGGCRFTDVTALSGLTAFGFGMGCCAGDFNNDGFADLYVATYGRNRLWQNCGDGTFEEVTEPAGVGDEQWGCSPAFADLNGDGLLDLYVVNYVSWNSDDPPCDDPEHPEVRRTCSPLDRDAQADLLYVNQGDGTFVDHGPSAGIADLKNGKGLALAILDFNGDGRLDIYVANDTTPNSLFENAGNLTFNESAVLRGVAVSPDGLHGASMGVGCADYNADGLIDVVVTNFRNQIHDFFVGLGDDAGFLPASRESGLDLISRRFLSFGVVFTDFDLDSFPDMFVANGHIWDLTSLGTQYEYRMPPSLIQNRDGQRLIDVSTNGGGYFKKKWLGRAVAFGDLDNDGDFDLVVQHLDDPAAVLRNDSERRAEGLRVRFIGTRSARDPTGCRVDVSITRPEGRTQQLALHIPSGESFQASHDSRVLVPVAEGESLTSIRITWPDGTREEWDSIVSTPATITLIEGTGHRVSR